jgi:Homoserine dehydrogenase
MVNIAILGFGVIGSGVADIISQNYELIKKHVIDDINIKYIVDLRDFKGHKLESKFTKDFKVVLNDPDVSVVIEMIGGSHPAYDFSLAALNAGKSVITSNKEVVANFGHELIAAADANNVKYMFEASVGGGIPIIRPISTSLAGNEIYEITGILNGTSNYILTQMELHNKSMADALKEAQEKGYAEADPSADIEGFDTCRKICILAGLAFGKLIPTSFVSVKGISDITLEDIENAKAENCAIKLLGRAVKLDTGKIHVSVAPYKVRKDNPLANINDVYNGILVRGDSFGDVMFYGKGAGSLPTASAVLSDLIEIIKYKSNDNNVKQLNWIYDTDGESYEPALPLDKSEESKIFLGTELAKK